MVNHLLALPEELLRHILHIPEDTRAGDSLSSLQVAVLRGGLCRQLRQLLQRPGWRIPVRIRENCMVAMLPSMFYASRCYEIAELQVEGLSCESAHLFTAAARALQLQRLTCLRLQDTMLYPGRYRLLLEQLPVLQHIDFIDVHTIDHVELQRRHFCYHLGDWGRQTPPPLRRFEAFTVTLIDAIWNKWTDWLAALGSAAAGLEQVGLTFASPEPRDIGGAMVFAKLHTLKLDVVVYVPCEVWVSLWHRTPTLATLAIQLFSNAGNQIMTEALCASLTEARLPALHKLHVFAAVTCHTLVCYFYATGSKALAMPALARLLLSGVGANGDGISQQTRATADLIRRQFLQTGPGPREHLICELESATRRSRRT